jgi:hypothetical protein
MDSFYLKFTVEKTYIQYTLYIHVIKRIVLYMHYTKREPF